MNKKFLFALWGGLFIICAGLGFIPEPTGLARAALTALSLAFFIPPALLIYQGEPYSLRLVRNLSILSLSVTLVLLVLNMVFALGSVTLGNLLHMVLVVVSSPMFCSGYWVLSLFLWACLLMVSISKLRKM